VAILEGIINKVRALLNPTLNLDGILATMYDPRTLHSHEVLERVRERYGDKLFKSVINRTVKFPDATASGLPITAFAPSSAAAEAYRTVARELVSRGCAP
jgi:chromosome partitioning protein